MRASAERIAENCEPSVCSVLFMGGAGGSLRAGVTTNPVRLTQSVKAALTRVSCGGASVYVWSGGGITVMADVMAMPANSFGYVPTSALVAPFEFTLRRSDYAALGGHLDHVQPGEAVMGSAVRRMEPGEGRDPQDARLLPDGRRLHLQHGPIDLIIGAEGAREVAFAAARVRFETLLKE